MDVLKSRASDDFGSVYSFEGLTDKLQNHSLINYKCRSPEKELHVQLYNNRATDRFSQRRSSQVGDAIIGSSYRRFSVFSGNQFNPVPSQPPANGGVSASPKFSDLEELQRNYAGRQGNVYDLSHTDLESSSKSQSSFEYRQKTYPCWKWLTTNLPECWFRFIVICLFLIFYMCIGAAVFCVFEREYEKSNMIKMKQIWEDFQKNNDIPQDLMERFLREHYRMCDLGDQPEEGSNVQWDYISSLFFTGTILTTIGYGHSSPSTGAGQGFTCIYAAIGIPIMLGLLNVVAEILLTTLKALKSKLMKKSFADLFHLEVFFSSLVFVLVLLAVMTFVFNTQESSWTIEQSLYFSFITMTTIGFGDFVPAQDNVDNNSPVLISREFFNMVLIFISVLIWYFLSQVTAQLVKVRLKSIYSILFIRETNENLEKQSCYNQYDVENVIGCTCKCTCGFYDESDMSSSGNNNNSHCGSRRFSDSTDNESDDEKQIDKQLEIICKRSISSTDSSSESDENDQVNSIKDDNELYYNIPTIVITPVEPEFKIPRNYNLDISKPHHNKTDCYYDSGKGSSEINSYSFKYGERPTSQNNRHHDPNDSDVSSCTIASNCSSPFPGKVITTPSPVTNSDSGRNYAEKDPLDNYLDSKQSNYSLRTCRSMQNISCPGLGSSNVCRSTRFLTGSRSDLGSSRRDLGYSRRELRISSRDLGGSRCDLSRSRKDLAKSKRDSDTFNNCKNRKFNGIHSDLFGNKDMMI